MKCNTKKIMASFLVGALSFGVAVISLSSVSEAHYSTQHKYFANGTSIEYNHRIQDEERKHKQNVRHYRQQLQKGDISEKEYNKQMRKEQDRHDREMKKIRAEHIKHDPYRGK